MNIPWLDEVIKAALYIAGAILIVGLPLALVGALVHRPMGCILKSWADARYSVIDRAMRATEMITRPDGTVVIKKYTNGQVDYMPLYGGIPAGQGAVETTELIKPNMDAIGAARWIVASYATTKCAVAKHQHGPDGRQLLTQDECIASSVFGSPRDWQHARDWMSDQWLVVEQSGTSNPGTFTDRPLSEMIDILTALPKRKK